MLGLEFPKYVSMTIDSKDGIIMIEARNVAVLQSGGYKPTVMCTCEVA